MQVTLTWKNEGLHFTAQVPSGHTLTFDSDPAVGGTDRGARPMEGLLSAMLACFAADVVSILQKKRKTVQSFTIEAQAQRREEFPKVFTRVEILVTLHSPDATLADVDRCIELARDKYCSAMAMFVAAGCEIGIQRVLHNTA